MLESFYKHLKFLESLDFKKKIQFSSLKMLPFDFTHWLSFKVSLQSLALAPNLYFLFI
jgi:hypothetical protein